MVDTYFTKEKETIPFHGTVLRMYWNLTSARDFLYVYIAKSINLRDSSYTDFFQMALGTSYGKCGERSELKVIRSCQRSSVS